MFNVTGRQNNLPIIIFSFSHTHSHLIHAFVKPPHVVCLWQRAWLLSHKPTQSSLTTSPQVKNDSNRGLWKRRKALKLYIFYKKEYNGFRILKQSFTLCYMASDKENLKERSLIWRRRREKGESWNSTRRLPSSCLSVRRSEMSPTRVLDRQNDMTKMESE